MPSIDYTPIITALVTMSTPLMQLSPGQGIRQRTTFLKQDLPYLRQLYAGAVALLGLCSRWRIPGKAVAGSNGNRQWSQFA